jgi:hypothetical protein
MSGPVVAKRTRNAGNDKMGCSHPNAARDEDCLSAKVVHPQNGRDCSEEHHDADDTGCEQGGRIAAET